MNQYFLTRGDKRPDYFGPSADKVAPLAVLVGMFAILQIVLKRADQYRHNLRAVVCVDLGAKAGLEERHLQLKRMFAAVQNLFGKTPFWAEKPA